MGLVTTDVDVVAGAGVVVDWVDVVVAGAVVVGWVDVVAAGVVVVEELDEQLVGPDIFNKSTNELMNVIVLYSRTLDQVDGVRPLLKSRDSTWSINNYGSSTG